MSSKQLGILGGRIAEDYLKKIPLNSKWQIDVIAIELNSNKKAKINHFENAIPYC
jgi:hypothetical protein